MHVQYSWLGVIREYYYKLTFRVPLIIVYTGENITAQVFERLKPDIIDGLKLSAGGKLVVGQLLDEIKGRRKYNIGI